MQWSHFDFFRLRFLSDRRFFSFFSSLRFTWIFQHLKTLIKKKWLSISKHISINQQNNDINIELNFNKKYVDFNTRTQSSWIDNLSIWHLTWLLNRFKCYCMNFLSIFHNMNFYEDYTIMLFHWYDVKYWMWLRKRDLFSFVVNKLLKIDFQSCDVIRWSTNDLVNDLTNNFMRNWFRDAM